MVKLAWNVDRMKIQTLSIDKIVIILTLHTVKIM